MRILPVFYCPGSAVSAACEQNALGGEPPFRGCLRRAERERPAGRISARFSRQPKQVAFASRERAS